MDEKGFSLRLARPRERKGVSARDMSLSMGQNSGYINNIESGKSMPSLVGLFCICDYLGITPSAFFDTDAASRGKLYTLVNKLKFLNDQQLDALAVIVDSMTKTKT